MATKKTKKRHSLIDPVVEATQQYIVSEGDTYDTTVPPSLQQKVNIVKNGDNEHDNSNNNGNSILRMYQKGHELGQGAFANVFLGTHRATKAQYAIKKIDRQKMMWGDDRNALEDEINSLILSREGPNIVQLYEVYEEKTHCYLVMELMRGGELFDRILEKKIFTEREARDTIRNILSGLAFMHVRRVVHRDLKPENLLLTTEDSDTSVKLADFGFAKKVVQENGLRTLCGTPGYLAPEVLERFPSYDVNCDLWSVGVILFLLLGGYLPFEDEDDDKVFERTRNGLYEFHPKYWKNISVGVKNLVTKLLTVNPKKRITADKALAHEWMLSQGNDLHEKKLNINKLKENVGKQRQNVQEQDRIGDLKKNFDKFLATKGDSQRRVVSDTQARKPQRKQEEDSKTGRPFDDFYELGDVLGEGGYACVFRAVHKRTNDIYAVKDINTTVLSENSKGSLKDEIAAMKLLRGGPHIIRLFDVFEEPEHTFMVMEECKGGDLLTRITEKEVYTEREARKTCKILFEAMDYIHKKKIAHRDIKPENILMVMPDDDASIKLADFGFAKRVPRPNCLRTLCGTAQYVAPEVLDLQSPGYDQNADMWSVGVVVYILLGGYAPFEGPVQQLARDICKANYAFHEKYWSDISKSAKSMISNMLQVDPDKRLSASEALECPWMVIEEETLAPKDLSGAQAALQNRKKADPTHKINPVNKYESLDVSFTAALGTVEEVMNRKSKFTEVAALDTLDEEASYVEDSSSGKPFESLYTWGRVITEGMFFVTHEVQHKQSKEIFAAKRTKRSDLEVGDAVALQDEISALQMVSDSPFVVRLFDVFEEPDFTYMVLERSNGGLLIDRIIEKRYYNEMDARVVGRKILLGLEHCHNKRIAIRNLTAENLVLESVHSHLDVKISDFGFAKRVPYPNALMTQCGTEGYVAPEILEHRPSYDVQCDMWSAGVVLYMLLGGYRPFRGEEDEVERKIRYGEYKFHKRYWREVSEEAKILISRMLTVNPIARITATGALQSDWLTYDSDYSGDEWEEEEVLRLELAKQAKSKMKATVNSLIAANKFKENTSQEESS